MGDRAAKGRLRSEFGIDMDELVIIGGLCKGIDTLLGDLMPVAHSQLRPDQALESFEYFAHGPDCVTS